MTTSNHAALFKAIEDGNIDAVQRMVVETPALLDARDEYGFPPLMCAVSRMERTTRLVQVLIEAGADVNSKTDEGYTALHMLVDVNGGTGTGPIPGEIARLLVAAGADTEIRQHYGWTPLMRAAVEGTLDELQALIDVGGDVNKLFPSDTLPEFLSERTTLMATIAHPDKTGILLAAGANAAAIDTNGQTALEYAQQCLLESAENPVDVTARFADDSDEALAAMLKQAQAAGIDLDAPIDATETTYKQTFEAAHRESTERTLAHLKEIDYAGDVRKSMRLIEAALARE